MLLWIMDSILTLYSYRFHMIYSVIIRGISSLFFSFFISLSIGYYIIEQLNNFRFFQSIRSNGPLSHFLKQGTPTMGGVIMLVSVIASVIIWGDLFNVYIWYVLYIFVTYGVLGFIDDFLKIKRKNSLGLSILNKYLWQSFIALLLIIVIFRFKSHEIYMPFNIWNVLLAYFTIVGTSNSVNLSDGLDGLAIIPIALVTIGLAIVAGITSNLNFSHYFHISYIFYVKELIIVCAAIVGTSLGFLWFNAYPAQIFMGDIGSLSFGGAVGVIAVLLQQEFLLFIMGGVFVIESLSVILQVGCFKIFRRRIFKMAPIHHHFELKGCSESKIVVRFWIISFILMLLGLIFLKLR